MQIKKNIGVLTAILIVALTGIAAKPYPRFDVEGIDVADDEIKKKALDPLFAELEKHLGTRLKQHDVLTSDDAAEIIQILDRIELSVPPKQWAMVTVEGRMTLPSVVANNGRGLICGLDAFYGIPILADDDASFIALTQYGFGWQLLFDRAPTAAFEILDRRHSNQNATSTGIVRLFAALGYWPGDKIQVPLSKSAWQQLHRSNNAINRLIALEKFDSVDQSPAELLALYRECLFGACSYLEVRALEAITRNKDFREEVAKLLEEYIASNPLANDGTLPGLRNNFPNLIEGAHRVISIIRGTYKPDPPQMPSSDPYAQQAVTPKPMPATGQANTPESPDKGPISSTLWLILGVFVVAATGLLWLLLKKRK